MKNRWLLLLLAVVVVMVSVAPVAMASPGSDMTAANQLVAGALTHAQKGDIDGAKAGYEQYRQHWLAVEDGVKGESNTAYRKVEEYMADVQFALLQNPPDPGKVTAAFNGLSAGIQTFVDGGYPADGANASPKKPTQGNIAGALAVLDKAAERAKAGDAPGAAQAMAQFRQSWLDVEGLVLTQSAKLYGDAERDMVNAQAHFAATPPNLEKGLATVDQMRGYLAPLASKTSYGMFDAATLLLREGLEGLLIVVALLGFLKRAGHPEKSVWIWGGAGVGLAFSAILAVAVKLLIGTGAFGNNNFLITGYTGVFAAVMLIWVGYWLHSKSSVSEWNRYIREKSSAALASGSLISLATLSFLATFREGTETVLFYIGMASSITTNDLLLGLGLGLVVLAALAVLMLKLGMKVPLRPFFLVSSLLVFYLGFKFTGMGIHGLQLAGVLPATVAPYLPNIDFLALYPNWQSTLPQIALLLGAVVLVVWNRRRDRAAGQALSAQNS